MIVEIILLPLSESGAPGDVPHYPGAPPGGGVVGWGGVGDVGIME